MYPGGGQVTNMIYRCVPITELSQTTELMNSSEYKNRFIAEYLQVIIRYHKLSNMLRKWDRDELDFIPTCPRSTYDLQLNAMSTYIAVLEARAVMEGIEL